MQKDKKLPVYIFYFCKILKSILIFMQMQLVGYK